MYNRYYSFILFLLFITCKTTDPTQNNIISGKVIDVSNKPIASVNVIFQNCGLSDVTDKNGEYEINTNSIDEILSHFTDTLVFSKQNFITCKKSIFNICSTKVLADQRMVKNSDSTIIKGIVTDSSHKPIAGVNVYFKNCQLYCVTDTNGAFKINTNSIVDKIHYFSDTLVFSKQKYITYDTLILNICTTQILANLILADTSENINISGKVIDILSKPISDVIVSFRNCNLRDTTDTNGIFKINTYTIAKVVSQMPDTLVFTKLNYKDTTKTISNICRTQPLTSMMLTKNSDTSVISGKVIDKLNLPIANVTVSLKNCNLSDVTDTNGVFKINTGNFVGNISTSDTLLFAKTGFIAVDTFISNIFISQNLAARIMTKIPGSTIDTVISGKVVDIQKQPIANVKVIFKKCGLSDTTDVNGSFSIKTNGLLGSLPAYPDTLVFIKEYFDTCKNAIANICSPQAPIEQIMTGLKTVTAPFNAALYFVPSGWMGGFTSDYGMLTDTCTAVSRPSDIDNKCTMITFKSSPIWGGVFWQYPDKNWGDTIGLTIVNAKKVTFWAKGNAGGEIVKFKAGGIKDRLYKDSFERETIWITLGTVWKQYEIDLTNANLSMIIGGFAWVSESVAGKEITFYIDEIMYE